MSYRLATRLVVGFVLASIAAAMLMVFAPSARAEPVRVEATVSEKFGRIIFAWASPVGFEVSAADGRFVVRFDRPIEADFDAALRRLAGYVGTARPNADGRSVDFALQRPVTVMSYSVGNTVIVDLMDKDATSDAPKVRQAGYGQEIVAYGFADSRYQQLPKIEEEQRRALARRVDIVILPTETRN